MGDRRVSTGDETTPARAGRHDFPVTLLERVVPGVPAGPALAVGFGVGAVVWMVLPATSWVALRFFLTSVAVVLSAVAAYLLVLNRMRPDRGLVRPVDLPIRLEVDASGAHLVEERGPRETIAWSAPHALRVWTDPDDRPLYARLTDGETVWTFLGIGAAAIPPALPTEPQSDASLPHLEEQPLARRHAPWEVLVRLAGDAGGLLDALATARAAGLGDLPSPACAWRIPLDAVWDPTAHWALRLLPGRLVLERAGVAEESFDLNAPLQVEATRLAFDPRLLAGADAVPAPTAVSTTDQPRLVPPDWAPLLLRHLGRDAAGRPLVVR